MMNKMLKKNKFRDLPEGCKKILASTQTLTSVQHAAYRSHLSNVYEWGAKSYEFRVVFLTQHRVEIAHARNNAVRMAIRGGFDYVFFYDDDTVMPDNMLPQLIKRMDEFNAISAGYFIRGAPFKPMVFRWIGKKRTHLKLASERTYKRLIDDDGVLRDNVGAVGMGCTLLRVDDFKKVPFPWFQTTPNMTEDVFWFLAAHRDIEGYKVGMDFNVKCGHILDALYVDSTNCDELRTAYRKVGGYVT
jgi:cellulose synthase/poly-beta-1,6-N-acetylglucosamine synthase-like glycosyltransferase